LKPARRLPAETLHLTLELETGRHDLDVSLAYDDEHYRLREIAFVGRGKIGQGMDLLLQDLSIKLSRAIQGRNPDTGDPIVEIVTTPSNPSGPKKMIPLVSSKW
jgi:hypothetical protein